MNALAKVIRDRMREKGWTYDDVAKRSGSLSRSTIHALATKLTHRQVPRSSTLEALARGLELPVDVLRLAAAESAGFHLVESSTKLSGAETMGRIVRVHELMDTDEQRALASMVEALEGQSAERIRGAASLVTHWLASLT